MSRKRKTFGLEVVNRAKALATSIYDNAGAFLIRTVCDEIAALLRELADQVDALDGEVKQLRWECEQADEVISQLKQELAKYDPPEDQEFDFGAPNSMTGGQGFSES